MRLEAKDISFRYDDKGPWLMKDVNFCLEEGQCVGLLGPSGYGKSTFAKILAGFETPTGGSVLLDNKPILQAGPSPVQLIYQHPEEAINPRWKMKQVLEEADIRDSKIIDAMGIQPQWLERYPRELSGGELQRFCVARALADGTRFLLADEISTMLDVITQAQIWELVLREVKRRGLGLLVVTHNPHLIKRLCHYTVRLEDLQGPLPAQAYRAAG